MPVTTPPQVDINKVIEEYANQGSAEQVQKQNLNRIEGELGSSTDTEVANIRAEGTLTGQIQNAVDALLLNRSGKNKETAAYFGVNDEASNSVSREMARSIIEQNAEVRKAGGEILKKQQKKFADNPLDWIVTQFEVPQDIAALNTRVAIMEQDAKTLEHLGNLADKQIARNNAIDANTTAAISDLVAKKALAAAEVRAQDARQKALATGMQIGSVRLAANQQSFTNMVSLHNATVAVEHLRLTERSLAINEEQKELQKQNLRLLIERRDKDLDADAELQGNLDQATAVLGMRRISTNEYANAPQQTKAALFDVMSNPNVKQGRLGYDSVDSLENANRLNAPLTPEIQSVKKMLTRWSVEAQNNPAFAALKPDQKHTTVEKIINQNVKQQATNIPDEGGLYSAPSMWSTGQIPAVSSTILWKSTFGPMAAANKNRPTSAQAVYDNAVDLIMDKKIDLDRASGEIAQIYKAITIDNTQQRDYNRLSLPSQNSYQTMIKSAGDDKLIDMTNKSAVMNHIMRDIAARSRIDRGGSFGIIP